ncbi:MAG TPA: hypothetical protein VF092_04565 [Longimicrobium sp.]
MLRDAVRRASEARSQRSVAAEIGISYRTVGKFLAGSAPYARTLKKLQEWFVSTIVPQDGVSPEAATAAVFIMLDNIPPSFRAEAVHKLVQALGDIHREVGVKLPGWISDLDAARSG